MTLDGYNKVEVDGARIELPSQQPVIVMRETDGGRAFPLWTGAPEFSVISMLLRGEKSPRPLTHELLSHVIEALDAEVVRVRIVDVQDMIFYARIDLSNGREVDSRASDAVIMALRSEAEILIESEVLNTVGVFPPEDEDPRGTDEQVAEFKEFLDDIDPSDFT